MIHALIDNPQDRNIAGFECGNRDQFDTRHGGDPSWVFLDRPNVLYQVNLDVFICNPYYFYIDDHGNLRKHFGIQLPPIPGYSYAKDTDGNYMVDRDRNYLLVAADD